MPIRLATVSDAAEIAGIYRPYVEDTIISFELEAPDELVMARRMERTLQRAPWLVAEERERILAYAYASRHHDRAAYQWSMDTSVYVRSGYHRRGLARVLYTELFARLVELGYYTAFAGISLPNAASVGLHQSFGFEPVGIYKKAGYKFGDWHDVGWWQKPLRGYTVPPEVVRSESRHL